MQSCMIISNATRRPSMLANMVKAAASWAHVWFATRIGAETETETGRLRDACYTKEELEQIVVRYKDMVYRLAVMRMKNSSLADDIFQETFLRLVRQRKRLESEEMLKAWLIRVTINECKRDFTAHWRKNEPLEAYAEKLHFSSEENSETFRTVMRLPRKYRMVIYLHYYEGYSTAEIAQILGSKQSTICTQLERGLKLLKNMLLEANDD